MSPPYLREPGRVHPGPLVVAMILTGLTIYYLRREDEWFLVSGVGAFYSWFGVFDRD